MSNEINNKSLFHKIVEAGNSYLDAQIFKSKSTILNSNVEDDFFFGKAVVEDPSYSLHSQGFLDKPYRIQAAHLKQMSYQDTVVAGVIQTRQNQIANHAMLVKSTYQKGFQINLRDEDALLEKIKEELRAELEVKKLMTQPGNTEQGSPEDKAAAVHKSSEFSQNEDISTDGTQQTNPEDSGKSDDEIEAFDFELERKAKAKLVKQFADAQKDVEQYILNCGKSDNRPFETKKWNFGSALRAWTRDTLTYDLYATETVPDRAGRPHHWFPIDSGTVKRASKDLRKFKDVAENFYNLDILYPEKTKEASERQKAIDLDDTLLEQDAYKWVQVIRGKVERAYTADELAVGIRNVNTDIFNNGYGISELELLLSMVTGHLNAEYYNQAYFTQGFSAKGILHIKSALNRRKVESVRTEWHHMLKGSKNSFQTPIFAGVEDVQWIPLTQNHNDIGFEGWMRYLITMIGCIFQIDPAEMGIHLKAEGSGGGLGSKDNTQEKIDNSKDRGLFPLLNHIETYINDQIIKPFDSRFILKFTGVNGENPVQTLARQEREVKFKKTVNEIRAEDGLPSLPGMDDIILDPQYMAWYNQYSTKALEKQQQATDSAMQLQVQAQDSAQQQNADQGPQMTPEAQQTDNNIYGDGAFTQEPPIKKSMKPLKIEIYKMES
jgi:hypothetical protein